jgi:hypothetical protein
MALYRVSNDALESVAKTTFSDLALRERDDLQKLLRSNLGVLDDGLLLVAEEYGSFEGSQRRIDLLAVDRSARLVVIELKRTADGGHMELQSLRYAAMVSTMTVEHLVETYATTHSVAADEARRTLEEWVDEGELITLSSRVRIVLASADFSTEITATVLWLSQEYGVDISCFRLVPYVLGGETLLDVQRIIPLPEATDFQIQQRAKGAASAAKEAAAGGRDYTKYDITVEERRYSTLSKQSAVRTVIEELSRRGVAVQSLRQVLFPNRWIPVSPEEHETPEQAFRREHPSRGGHYWFDLNLTDSEGTWIVPRLGGTRTERFLTDLQEIAPSDVTVTWAPVAP